ncbi:hypothetical protein RHGRI_021372 [Rhododendron griersonianum]|uniref:Uncharacterized protein n=1 Tax=Rhododendron griersonianum TaxID=479676 RepID=A0AAV6JNX5_9ERIC|nr:hypothetical protein RHGRI_021372 [Rhododendron griersonianum]
MPDLTRRSLDLMSRRWITLLGYVIKMHMHVVVKSAQHNRCCLCMRTGLMNDLAARRKLEDLTVGPVPTVVTEYKDNQLPTVLDALERMRAHLTAAVVSNDQLFLQARLAEVIGKSVNGTTYAGLRARTTGAAPQNHW